MKTGALISVVVLALVGCSSGQSGGGAQLANAKSCPATDFPAFAEAFMKDEAVQRRFIRLPLSMMTLMDGPEEGEPIGQEHEFTAETLPRPLIPTRAQQAQTGLKLGIHDPRSDHPWLQLTKAGAEFPTNYIFEPTADCWRLIVLQN
ncbi:MAG: hypothetical protein JWM33_1477 [Caulobacteraceae bacterium]|nr:hypothetical protein [Caulobacteraceae bacterium]